MNDQREQKIQKWNVRLDPIRFTNRENGIKEWLVQNNAKRFLTLTEELLSSLPKKENHFGLPCYGMKDGRFQSV
ncbi:hypothetical protein [Leptospira santarosai]|uniref:Uncharacterized protein n=1 Tax=Leptospira santarosai serovar Shermani str. LT 821 TaxID=758847 RepID=K8Y8F2_9LEPT|nr:hypothetical protein [Leptospira santarosai]EKT86857.1 hypothetical protein LSS_10428 [Leptospira santarosai serovar Shermani str. LT 821]EPG84034.1 hypothetical protein LEP1GSC048_1835 [Leptospira santarosai serovar Shermani str. 1342KT]